ncbi:MAG: aminoacyltransferase [Bifidobacterium sp.]|nr:aminoacyltransferase [Bifidobacterium sp.]
MNPSDVLTKSITGGVARYRAAAGDGEKPALRARALTDAEFDALSAVVPQGNFQQTTEMRDLAANNADATSLVGIVDAHNVPVAGAMVAYTPSRLGETGSVWVGPLADPDDAALLGALTDAIRADAKRHRAMSVSAWPGSVYRRHPSEGAPDGDADELMMRNFKDLGWQHGGFDVGYGSVVNRWVYVKDLSGFKSAKELLASYAKNTRRNVKIADNSCVEVRRVGRDELGTFHDICELSAGRQGFHNRSLEYAQEVFDAFGDDAHFMVAEIHLDRYLKAWEDKLAAARKTIDELGAEEAALAESGEALSDKKANRLRTARQNADAAVKRIAKAKEYIAADGTVVPVAAALFIVHPNEMVYLMSGSNDKYAKFYAPTALQHWAMSWCVEHGLDRYNFYGISGYFDDDPSAEGHGVLEFKQGFNGYVEELPGEFTLPVSKGRYALKGLLEKVMGH